MSIFENKKDSIETYRIIVFLSPFLILLFFAFLQILNLSYFNSNIYKTQSDSNRLYQSKIAPQRGFIFDTKNTLLVENNIQQDLEINPSFIENPRVFLKQISDLLASQLNGNTYSHISLIAAADEDFALLKKNRKLINAKSISKENH